MTTKTKNLQINELLELQTVDIQIGNLQRERDALDQGERVERALAIRQARLAQAERRVQGIQLEQRASELELKALEAKKHESSRKLYEGRITAPRELQSLEMEIAMLERQRQRLDELILKRMEEVEAAVKTVESVRGTVEEAEKALRIVQKRFEKDSSRIDNELERLYPERDRLLRRIDPEIVRRYDAIRHRQHNIGAVRIENNACGGCRMKVGEALRRRVVVNEEYVFCESCSRFLFPPEEEG